MVVEAEQQRVKKLLTDALPLLCKTGLSFASEVSIEALIGITLDKNDIFLVNISETVKSTGEPDDSSSKSLEVNITEMSPVSSDTDSVNTKAPRKRNRSEVGFSEAESAIHTADDLSVKRKKLESIKSESEDEERQEVLVKQEDHLGSTMDEQLLNTVGYSAERAINLLQTTFLTHASSALNHAPLPDNCYAQPHTENHIMESQNLQQVKAQSLPDPGLLNVDFTKLDNESLALPPEQNLLDRPKFLPQHAMNIDSRMEYTNRPPPVQDSDKDKKNKGPPSELNRYIYQNGPSDWMCGLCQQHFTRGYSLQEHIRVVHLKERQHQCSNCPMRFGKRSNMLAHQKVCKQKSAAKDFVKQYDAFFEQHKNGA